MVVVLTGMHAKFLRAKDAMIGREKGRCRLNFYR
jgi:hypothetical protein